MFLCLAGRLFDGLDFKTLVERHVRRCIARHVAAGNERDLIAQVGQLVVHRRGREQQDFCSDPLGDHFIDEFLVARLPGFLSLSRRLPGPGVVSEIVRFVDDQEIIVSPVQGFEVDAAHFSSFP